MCVCMYYHAGALKTFHEIEHPQGPFVYVLYKGGTTGEKAGQYIALWGPNQYPFINSNTFLINICCFLYWILNMLCYIQCCCYSCLMLLVLV